MAGIGFELKTLFERKGLFANIKAYGYASIVCTGPMLLGIVLLFGVRIIAKMGGAVKVEQDFLVSMITYTLLASLTVSSILTMVVTRFTADMLYIDKSEWILPSFYGSSAILLIIGIIVYGAFLLSSGIALTYQILCLVLFCVLIIVWLQVSYVTALRDYRSILLWFAAGVVATFLSGFFLLWLKMDVISALLTAVIIGYGIMMTGFFVLMQRYFPQGQGSSFRFLEWIDRYPSLLFVGLFLLIGMFSHLAIVWFGPNGARVNGLFYDAPQYDVPAFLAFLSVLPATVSFVTSVETNFYPKYKHCFDLYNNGGTLKDIELAESEMMRVLKKELYYLAQRQFITTALFIIVGGSLILPSTLGMTESAVGTFRILCIGYGLYAVANSIMLILLYFADNKGALLATLFFMVLSTAATLVLSSGKPNYYGFGFLLGGVAMYLIAWIRLWSYTNRLQYHILCAQPVLVEEKKGLFTMLSKKLQMRAKNANKVSVKNVRGRIRAAHVSR